MVGETDGETGEGSVGQIEAENVGETVGETGEGSGRNTDAERVRESSGGGGLHFAEVSSNTRRTAQIGSPRT